MLSRFQPVRAIVDGFSLLLPRERRVAYAIVALTILAGALDVLALGAAMPFIAMLVDPDAAMRYPFLERVRSFVGFKSHDHLIVAIGVGCLCLVIASSLLNQALQRYTNRFAANCQARLAAQIMADLVRAPYVWFLGVNSARISHVFQRDVLLWARELVLKTLTTVRDISMIVLPTILMVVATPMAGLAALLTIGVLVGGVLRFTQPRIRYLVSFKQKADEEANLLAVQALTGVKDVKLSGREHEFVSQFGKAYSAYTWAHSNLTNWHQFPVNTIMLAGQVGMFAIALVLWSSGVSRGEMAAQLALLVLVTSRVLPAANRLAGAVTVLYGVLPAVSSVRNLVAEVREGSAMSPARSDIGTLIPGDWCNLELARVDFTYPGSNRKALSEISMTIEPKKAYGLVGPSGAGKSTLVDIISGLLAPANGAVCLDGRPLVGATLKAWQQRVGYVPQTPFITDDTLASNVAFGLPREQIDQERLSRALEGANLAEFVASLPEGTATRLGDRGVRLSGGQRQRIAVARALYEEADLLILDEATNALDMISERAVQEAVERLHGRVATLAIAHRLSTIRNCDRIFVVDGGRLVASGNWNELLVSSALFLSMVDGHEGRGAA